MNKYRGIQFPLRDNDYETTSSKEQQGDDVFDICSNSFLEKLGCPNNQIKSTTKFKKAYPSPTINYYSQLLSQPIQVQKHKTQTMSQTVSELDKSTKNTDNENKENFHFNTSFTKTVPDKICIQEKVPELDTHNSPSSVRHVSSQQILPERIHNENELNDINFPKQDSPLHILAQNKPNSYCNIEYGPQIDLNRSYLARPNQYIERYPNTYMRGNHENIHISNYSCQDHQGRFSNFEQDPHRRLIKDNYSMRYYGEPVMCYDYPKLPQRYWLNENICGRICQNTENIPVRLNRDTERKLTHPETISLNQSQILHDFNEDFHQQRQYSQYFQKNLAMMNNPSYRPVPRVKSERDYGILSNTQIESVPQLSQQKYPEMLSLQNLSQLSNCPQRKFNKTGNPQNRTFAQQKSFEEKINEENNLRNAENFPLPPILNREVSRNQNVIQNCGNRTDPHFLQKDSWPYHEEYSIHPRRSPLVFHSSSIVNQNVPQNSFDRGLNDTLVKNLDRSFVEKSNFTRQSVTSTRNPERPEQTYSSQRNDMNRLLYSRNSTFPHDWNIQDQNFRYYNGFDQHQQNANVNRTFTASPRLLYPQQNYHMPLENEEINMFPPSNDKEYVMNKFLFSLDEK